MLHMKQPFDRLKNLGPYRHYPLEAGDDLGVLDRIAGFTSTDYPLRPEGQWTAVYFLSKLVADLTIRVAALQERLDDSGESSS